ncbi:MAG: exodeoxyribonuclease VII large subunit [Chlorobi bacterium]|nr:exodeoxyribonuclease VII large subunit [Chlorobiota bacterium]MCI0715079.1 exodeoxyribonuclease VII large subunit [Chlorobiota bacterium]
MIQGNLPQILTVSELNFNIKTLVEENFRFVHLIGEISNFKVHSQSGHYYFTLKDSGSQISAVMWRTRNENLLFTPEDGMQIVVKGRITVFPAKGSYQIEVWELKPQGMGELQARFEKLKQKLFEEGMFDEAHKMELPKFPENIVLITSKTGAVLHDFIKICKRRYPLLNIYLYPVNVQGVSASSSIIEALRDAEKFQKFPVIDIIVIARGGGSLEDLLPFNDERLARVIFSCKIPIVSAVGHEVDFTICDFVADMRAPTPSAAAELITPNIKDLIESIDKFSYFSRSFVQSKTENLRNSLREVQGSYYFNRPKDLISEFNMRIDELSKGITGTAGGRISSLKSSVKFFKQTLHHISPRNNLKKGYAIVRKKVDMDELRLLFEFEKIVTRASGVGKNEEVEIEFHDNKKQAKITS